MFEHKERFEAKYQCLSEDECWPWQAAISGNGYGAFKIDGRQKGAHQVSYELYIGDIPIGMLVLHTCDNPLCINPAHLKLGTVRDNTQDMLEKGRNIERGNYKLTANDVQHIRALYAKGFSISLIHQRYYSTIGRSTISRVAHEQGWRHI